MTATVGPDDPEMVVSELWGHAFGFIEGDWSSIELRRPEREGPELPVVESLGNAPMTADYVRRLSDHEQVEEVWCGVVASVETTTRGPLPGRVIAAEVQAEDAVFELGYAGSFWYSRHPAWLSDHLAEREAESQGGDAGFVSAVSFDDFEEYRGTVGGDAVPSREVPA